MKKILLGILSVLVIGVIAFSAYVQSAFKKRVFDAPYPEIKASTDSSVIERGRYLAYGPAHCATCHVPMDKTREVENGLQIPLSGGWELELPLGTFRAPNITPDMETGIGKLSDGEIARTLRHSVGNDGRYIFEFMPFQNLSDEDLTAIISFLRSQPPVRNEVPRSEYSFMGKAIFSLMDVQPSGPTGTPPKTVAREISAEYGKYLVYSVANCYGCHTERNLQTGEFVGKPMAGGMLFTPDQWTEGYAYVSPNLTPAANTGIMASWSEDAFVSRFKGGRIHRGSPMPWGAFSRMEELDMRAIYRYLRSIEPVEKKIEKIVFAPGEDLPK